MAHDREGKSTRETDPLTCGTSLAQSAFNRLISTVDRASVTTDKGKMLMIG